MSYISGFHGTTIGLNWVVLPPAPFTIVLSTETTGVPTNTSIVGTYGSASTPGTWYISHHTISKTLNIRLNGACAVQGDHVIYTVKTSGDIDARSETMDLPSIMTPTTTYWTTTRSASIGMRGGSDNLKIKGILVFDRELTAIEKDKLIEYLEAQ